MKYFLRNQARRPKDTSPHVSLFPFLAVLICTMGALVPLLFTVSRQARLQAEQTAAAKNEEIKADVKSEREMAEWRIEQMQTSRKKTEADIQTARLELGHLEDHSRRLKAKVSELEKTVAEFDRSGNDEGQRRTATNAELEELRKQIAEAERQLEEAKKNAAGKKRSFAIIPYEGPNSTHRRPIYIECRGDAIVLQPEGIMLTVHDFEGPMGPSNPLAAALRTEREYLLSKNGFDPQRDGEPYPLLLVRPDGVIAYYAARAAMKSWGAEFGYDFIEADWKLAYQPADPQLANAVHDAVASARVIQERLIAAAPREYKRRAASSSSSDSSNRVGGGRGLGGSGSGSGNGGAAGGYAQAGGSSRGSGGSGGSGGAAGGYGGFGGAREGDEDSDSWDSPMSGEPDPFLTGKNNPYASLTVGGTGVSGARTGNTGVVGGSGGGVPGGGVPGSGSPGVGVSGGGVPGVGVPGVGVPGVGVPGGVPSGVPSGANRMGSAYGGRNGSVAAEAGPILGNPNGSAVAGAGGVNGAPGSPNGMAGGGYPTGTGQAMGSGIAQGGSGLPGANGMQGNAGTGGQGYGGAAAGSAGSSGNNGGQGMPAGDGRIAAGQGTTVGRVAANGQPSSLGQGNTQGQGGEARQAKPPSEPPDIFASRVAASNAAKYGTDNRPAEDCPAPAGGQISQPLHAGEWYERPKPPPTPVVQEKKDPVKKKESMAKHRGQDWGLHDNPVGAVPITRPVVVQCQADRLVLQPERGRGGNPMVLMASGTDSSIDDLVSAIWDRMTQWGMAGRGMYWRPVLHIRVAPGGEQRFADLQTLLEGSGLDVVKQ